MTREVREILEALVVPGFIGRVVYEELRGRVIAEVGYAVFRDRQREAFHQLAFLGNE